MQDLDHILNFRTHSPMLPVEVASWLLNLDRERVVHSVEDGRLAWAWNFSVPPAKRQELRIWRGSVAAWLRSGGEDGAAGVEECQVLADILPDRDFWTSELKRVFALHRTTLQHFIDLDFLPVKEKSSRDGVRNLASRIGRPAVVRFLRRARVG